MKTHNIWLNNWSSEFCPNKEPFLTWLDDDGFTTLVDPNWVKNQKGLTVCYSDVDMSINFAITATEEWINNNCPCILTNSEYKEKFTEKCVHVDEDLRKYADYGTPFIELNEYTEGKLIYWSREKDKFYITTYDKEADEYSDEEISRSDCLSLV